MFRSFMKNCTLFIKIHSCRTHSLGFISVKQKHVSPMTRATQRFYKLYRKCFKSKQLHFHRYGTFFSSVKLPFKATKRLSLAFTSHCIMLVSWESIYPLTFSLSILNTYILQSESSLILNPKICSNLCKSVL